MHADSMAIRSATPAYPDAEMVAMMKWARKAKIFSVIRGQYTFHFPHARLHFGGIAEGL